MAAKTVKQINPSELNHYLPIPIHKDFRKKLIPDEKNVDRLKSILGIEPKENLITHHRKEKSYSLGRTKLDNSTTNSYKANKSLIAIEANKQKKIIPRNFKISFIKKTYGKLQPFKQQSEAPSQIQIKANNIKKLPLINSNSPNQINNDINIQNENKMQILHKLNKKKSEVFLNESIKKGKQNLINNNFDEAIKLFQEILKLNMKHIESHYYLGFALLHKNQYEPAIENLEFVINHDIVYSRSAYILLAVCFKKVGKIDKCLETLDVAINHNPKFYDALVYRGKIYLKKNELEKALLDFNGAFEIEAKNKSGRTLSPVMMKIKKNLVYKKKANILIRLGRRDEASQLLNMILKQNPEDSEIYCLLGELLEDNNRINDAYLNYQQALKFNNHSKTVTRALFNMAKINILDKDFYTASYNLNKTDHLELKKEKLINIMLFTNGVSCLMKKKYEEALGEFNDFGVVQKITEEEKIFHEMIPKYRAFAYFSLGQYQNAFSDYNNITKIEQTDLYNKMICEGILKILNLQEFELGLSLFEKTTALYPGKMEPYFYIFASYVFLYNQKDKSDSSYIESAIKHLEKAEILAPTNSSILYCKSLMALIFEENVTCIQDLTQAIEGSDEGKAEYYFLRGVAFADLSLYPQAYSDFSLALSFNSKWQECYYNRAVCSQFLGDVEGCLNDVKTFLNFGKNKENSDLMVGHFLYCCGLYEEAVNSYSQAEDFEIAGLIEKIKCLIHMKELNLCLEALKRLIEVTDSSEEFVNDFECLLALKAASQKFSNENGETKDIDKIDNVIESGKDGLIFKMSDFCFYKAVFCFYEKKYQEAIDNFIKAYQLKSFLTEIKNECGRKNTNSSDPGKNDLLSEVSSFTFHEYLYNLIICYIQMKEFNTASNICEELDDIIPTCYKDNVRFLKLLIHQSLNEKPLLQLSQMENTTNYFEVFSSETRLCSIFPPISIELKNLPILETRLSFCLPKPEPPPLSMNLDLSLLEKISPLIVENKPEAPWIKKEHNCLIFTDNLQNIEEIEFASEQKSISESVEKD